MEEFVNVNLFGFQKNLTFLNLSNNLVLKLEKGFFQNLTRLEKLDLSSNYLDSFGDEDIFIGLKSLTVLNLSSNYIKALSKTFLKNLFSLKNLNLRNNGLKYMEAFAFKDLKQLDELNLESNKLNSIPETDTFAYLSKLKQLNLNSNNFKSINETLKANLKHLISLESLLMANNYIEYLNGNDFEFNPGLKTIDLNFNQIKFIHLETFSKLKSLSSLFLSATQMDFVEIQILKGKKMIKLDFSFNKILVCDVNFVKIYQKKTCKFTLILKIIY